MCLFKQICQNLQSILQRENPMELNFVGFEVQKRLIPIDRGQRIDKKNGIICLVTIFTPKVMVMVVKNGSF